MSRQTAYIPLQTISTASYENIGGFCKFWYTPIENLAYDFPLVNPATQMLFSEPLLLPGTTWYGPVEIPDSGFGWTEEPERSAAGPYYKQKVLGFVPGLSAANHINFQNLAFHKFAVVGLTRSGGNFYIIGDLENGLDATFSSTSGIGGNGTPGTQLQLAGETIDRAYLLPGFAGILSQPPVFGSNNGTGNVNSGTNGGVQTGSDGNTGGTTGNNTAGTTTNIIGTETKDLSITALGNEGYSLYVPALTGKKIILLARESNILKQVASNPNNRQYTVNSAGNLFTFTLQIDPEEEFKFIYNA